MKRLLSVLILAVLLFTATAAVAQGLSAGETMALYSGAVGHVAFALPNMP